MTKYEWRKKEKQLYLPKNTPERIVVPPFTFLTITGKGNPNTSYFADCVSALYSVSYAVKMTLKRLSAPPMDYMDYTVYPLEGIWDLNEKAKQDYDGSFHKDDLVYTLMIRQPDFVTEGFFREMLILTRKKKPNALLDKLQFETTSEGPCVQMLHLGPYDTEPQSFAKMEEFSKANNWDRCSKAHREIYLSDFRKVAPEKLKTVLRFKIKDVWSRD